MQPSSGWTAAGGIAAHVLARAGPGVALATAIVAAFGLLGRAAPLPDYGPAFTILDTQMRRSHALGGADVLFVGDSSALYGIDPAVVAAGLGGPSVESLAAIGPARPPGYAKLLGNHLARAPRPKVVVLLLHPIGLMHAVPPHKQREMQAVLADAWPRDPFWTGARKAINRRLLGGLVEEPLGGEHGRHYGSALVLERALRRDGGGLVHPARAPLPEVAAARAPEAGGYALHPDGLRDLRAMGDLLRTMDTTTLRVGLAPVPEALVGPAEAAARARTLATILDAAGLPADRALDLPRSLPTDEFVELTHVGAAGRRHYSRALVPIIRRLLDVT